MKRLLLLGAISLATVSIAQVPSYVPTNGLSGWWGFTGNADDASSNVNHGTVNGAVLIDDRFGNPNSAYSFDGTDDYIEVLHNSSFNFEANNVFTVSFWIAKIGYTGTRDFIIFKRVNNQPGGPSLEGLEFNYVNQPGGPKFVFETQGTNGSLSYLFITSPVSTSLLDNNWHHFVYIFDNGESKIFVDNNLVNSLYESNSVLSDNIENLIFGAGRLATDPDYYLGSLDDIGIWNFALDSCQIEALYTGTPCVVGQNELNGNEKVLLKVTDLMGREVPHRKNKVLIYVYSDGTTERVFEFE